MAATEKELDAPLSTIEELIEHAKEQGYITSSEILEVLPEAEANLSQLEDLFFDLYDEGIDVVFEEAEEPAEEGVDADVPEESEL